MTKKIEMLENEKKVVLDTEKDIFLGCIANRESRVTYYVHRSKNGRVFYADEWGAWLKDFNGIGLVDEDEVKYYLGRHYTDTSDYDMQAIRKIWPDFLQEN